MIKKECLICKKEFLVKPYREEIAKFCSQKCYHEAHKQKQYPKSGFQKGHKGFVSKEGYDKISEKLKGNKHTLGKHWKCSEEIKKRMSEARKGIVFSEQHLENMSKAQLKRYSKIPKKTKRYKHCTKTYRYRKWRKAVFEYDHYICWICNQIGGYLQPHHLKGWAHYPKLRFEIANGVTLCRVCHKLTFKQNHR